MRRCAVRAPRTSCASSAARSTVPRINRAALSTNHCLRDRLPSFSPRPFAPRRWYSQPATVTPDFRDYKRTTGLVGIPVLPPKEARQIFLLVAEKILAEVKEGIPAEAGYRIGVEATFEEWIKIGKANPDPRDIERLVDMGQIEELIQAAENELKLIPMVRLHKPWEVEPGKKIPITIRGSAPLIKDKTGALLKPPAPSAPGASASAPAPAPLAKPAAAAK